MDRPDAPPEEPAAWMLPSWAWLLGAALLLAWHGWLTLALFGDDPLRNLFSDEPIVSGAHPQHQYLGQLGARAIWTQGRTTVYDTGNLVGYPKTPIFDGARLAELLFLCGGGTYQPAAYKLGFAVLCMFVPIFLLVTCKTLDLSNGTALLATFLGQLIWWGPHGRTALVTGDCELYLASLAGLAHIGCLIAYHRDSSVTAWFGLWITGCIAWFLQPLLFPIALPVLLIFYLSVGAKHDFLTWHVALLSAEALGFLINLPWLNEWFYSWWLRTPLPISTDLLEHRTFATMWNAPIWGGPTSRFLAILVTLGGSAGVVILNQSKQRAAARMLAMSGSGALLLALLGISWEPLGAYGTSALLAPALWFACVPAAHACVWLGSALWRRGKVGRGVLGGLVVAAAVCFLLASTTPMTLVDRCLPGEPFQIGLGHERQEIVHTLKEHTNPHARILWEDRQRGRQASRWAALLPYLTQRSFIGGLDPDMFIEHSSITLNNQVLDNKVLAGWKDAWLMDYCRRYNVRWIAAWSPAVIGRLEEWKDVKKIAPLVDGDTGWLFEVQRTPTYALKGHAELLEADGQFITLANVIPDKDGVVEISMHYQQGMRASPGRVQIERAPTGEGSIDFVRLRLAVPAARVTLTWER